MSVDVQNACGTRNILVLFLIVQAIVAICYLDLVPWPSFEFIATDDALTTVSSLSLPSIEPMKKSTIDYDIFFADKYLRGYNHWIRGLGATKLQNTEGSNCLYPPVPFTLDTDQTWNRDFSYYAIARCNAALFSEVFERTALIRCAGNPSYFESESFYHGVRPEENDPNWKELNRFTSAYNKDDSVYTLKLHNTTQLIWIRCGRKHNYHFALLPLRQQNHSLFDEKQQTIQRYFKGQKPPNVLIFVMDSTARSNFIRGAPESVDYLSGMLRRENDGAPSKILQWFRYSTIAWGTGHNMGALLAPNGANHSLSRYFDDLGYYVPGWRELLRDDTKKVSWQGSVEPHYLSTNVFNKGCRGASPGKLDIDLAVDFALQLDKQNKDIPWFTVLHTQTNHVRNAIRTGLMDRYVRRLIEYMDKSNTIIHLAADHGTYQTGNIYGTWESQNPVGIHLIPNYLFDGVLNLTTLRTNEQRLVHHRDMSRFYRELLYKLSNKILKENSILNYNESVMMHVSGALSASIIDKEIAIDRPCKGIKLCFCETFQKKTDVPDPKYAKLMINTINALTGDGGLQCKRLNPNDFKIVELLQSKHVQIVEIEQTQQSLKGNISNEQYETLKREFQILRYSAVIQGGTITNVSRHQSDIPYIIRKDYFKYEPCLTTEYDLTIYAQWHPYFQQELQQGETPEPVFRNQNMTIQMLQQQRELWNLRLCNCKTRNAPIIPKTNY